MIESKLMGQRNLCRVFYVCMGVYAFVCPCMCEHLTLYFYFKDYEKLYCIILRPLMLIETNFCYNFIYVLPGFLG